MHHPMVAGAIMVGLIGVIVGLVVGWAARGDFNRAWWRGTAARLAETQAQLAEALAQLEQARTWRAERVSPAMTPVVNVNVAAPLPWVAHQPLPVRGARVLDAVPVPPVGELSS
ncbi:MAG: hypothetical protein ACRDRI_05610 [Pseudonocardiaceae bacterium]